MAVLGPTIIGFVRYFDGCYCFRKFISLYSTLLRPERMVVRFITLVSKPASRSEMSCASGSDTCEALFYFLFFFDGEQMRSHYDR